MKTFRRTFFVIMVGVLCLFIVSVAFAGHPEISRIKVDELKKLIDVNADIIILDARAQDSYDGGHIKGALALPWKSKLNDADVKGLAKQKLIVTYCSCGVGEADGSDLADQLIKLGFTNVKVLEDPSITGWIKAGYPLD